MPVLFRASARSAAGPRSSPEPTSAARHHGAPAPRVAPGLAADLLLFDPARVGRGPKRRVFDLPGGAPRLTTDALGVDGVWVNGVRVADANGPLPLGRLPGILLRDQTEEPR